MKYIIAFPVFISLIVLSLFLIFRTDEVIQMYISQSKEGKYVSSSQAKRMIDNLQSKYAVIRFRVFGVILLLASLFVTIGTIAELIRQLRQR